MNLPLTNEQIEELILARYYYSYGLQYKDMSDTIYESNMDIMRKEAPDHWLVLSHWSNDPMPLALLQKYNLPVLENRLASFLDEEELPEEVQTLRDEYEAYYADRYSDTSQKSIELIQDYDTIYSRIEPFAGMSLHASIKADGLNFTAVYFKGHLVYGRTKGRTGNPFDITLVLRIVLRPIIQTDELVVIISGELVCYKQSLPYLREQYRQAFKSTRSAVTTLLRGGLSSNDIFNHLKPLVFKVRCEELHTLQEEFAWAKENGFNTPAHVTFKYTQWSDIMDVLTYFTPFKENLPYSSDGVVIGINDNDTFYSQGETGHHYMGNLALKVGVWNPGYYVGVVTDIKWSIGEYVRTPEAVIEPVLVKHGSHVSSIPLDNIARMVEHNILPGAEIYFKVTGDSKITLVHRQDELENMKLENI